jgi:hypothetical protein
VVVKFFLRFICRIPDVYQEDIKKLKLDPQLPLSYLLQEDVGLQESICGNIQEGSMLKYHVRRFTDIVMIIKVRIELHKFN